MPFDLKSIKGIGVETEKKLTELNVADVSTLRTVTETPKKREDLSKKINVSMKDLYTWSKQAELMKVEGITGDDATLLVQCGIRNIEDLKNIDGASLLKFINTVLSKLVDVKKVPTLKEIALWKTNAGSVDSKFQKDKSDEKNSYVIRSDNSEFKKESHFDIRAKNEPMKESKFFNDLSEVITEIGIGIAGAQHQLDLSSMDIQNAILENDKLAPYGLNATWYTIPEVNFNMKMEYMMVEESSESGTVSSNNPVKRIFVSPSNAKYNNLFKSSRTEESSLNLKFVPIPPPERLTERNVMPNLIGLSQEEAEEELAFNQITVKDIKIFEGETENGKNSEVTYQSVEPGKIMLINEQPEINITVNASE